MLSSEEVLRRGVELYEKIKARYEPEYNGKFLAIDVETGKAYMGDRMALAMEMGDIDRPGSQHYVLRIGYDTIGYLPWS